MKLTDEELEKGREMVRAHRIDALVDWADRHKVLLDKELLRRTMSRALAMDPERALKLFDEVFVGMDPAFDRKVVRTRSGCFLAAALVLLLGCVGGIVYLVRTIFGG